MGFNIEIEICMEKTARFSNQSDVCWHRSTNESVQSAKLHIDAAATCEECTRACGAQTTLKAANKNLYEHEGNVYYLANAKKA